MSRRRCLAIGCEEQIPGRFLMCRRHWAMLPRDLRHIWWECCRDYERRPNRHAHDVLSENLAELCRLLWQIELGQPCYSARQAGPVGWGEGPGRTHNPECHPVR